jgi:hypothetical protein
MKTEELREATAADGPATQRLLGHARRFLQRGWCQRFFARDAKGQYVGSTSPIARSWCILGALRAARDELGLDELTLKSAINVLGAHAHTRCLQNWNDSTGRTQEEALRLFDEALGGK